MMRKSPFTIKHLFVAVTVTIFTVFGGITGLALADSSPDVAAAYPEDTSFEAINGFVSESLGEESGAHPVIPINQDDTDDGDDADEGTPVDEQPVFDEAADCQGCHSEAYEAWEGSLHDNAYEADYFQEAWAEQGEDPSCLECHTTNFRPATGEFDAEGVSCVGCHGDIPEDHPEGAAIDNQIALNSCQDCHPQTHDEFIPTDHAAVGLDCMSCHYPHDNGLRLEDATTQCLNCHGDNLEGFVHVSHIDGGLGCRDCHGWVDPSVPEPPTGLGYTGHDFMSELPACLDCHQNLDLEVIADNRDESELEDISEQQLLRGQEAIAENAELRATIDTLLQAQYNRRVQNVSLGAIGGLLVGTVVTATALYFQKSLSDKEEEE